MTAVACPCWASDQALGHGGHCCFTHGDRKVGNGFREDADICHAPKVGGRVRRSWLTCCGGWGEVRDGDRVVACATCHPDAYERGEMSR